MTTATHMRAVETIRLANIKDNYGPALLRGSFTLTVYQDIVAPIVYERRDYHDATELTAHFRAGKIATNATMTITREITLDMPAWLEYSLEELAQKITRAVSM